MQNKRLLLVTGILAVLVAVWRTLLMPSIARDGVSLTHISYPLLGVMAAAVALLFWFGRARGAYQPLAGGGAKTVAVGGALFGTAMLITAVCDAVALLASGTAPAPSAEVLGGIDRVVLMATLAAGVMGGVFLLVWFFGWLGQPYAHFSPSTALPVAVVGVATGIAVIVLTVKNWRSELAPLQALGGAAAQGMQRRLLIGLVAGVVIGALLVAAFVRWLRRRTFGTGWLWLLPVVWAVARLVRFDVVYAMSVDIAPAVYECFLYVVAVLFLLAVAQYMTGVMRPTRWMRALAASTAVLALSAVFSRVALAILGLTVAADYTPVPGVAELTLGLFALAVAGALDTTPNDSEKTE